MRTPLCSLELTPESLTRVRHCARGMIDVLGLTGLARARWLAAVAAASRAAVEAGGGTLTLLLDGSAERPSSCLAAEIVLPAGAAGDWHREKPALARIRALVDQLSVQLADGGVCVRLEAAPAGAACVPLDASLRARFDALLQQPLPTASAVLEQQEEELLQLLQAAQAEIAAARSGQAQTLGQLAHDLRSPLLTLNLSLEMLRMKPHSPAELEERREVMKRQTDELRAVAAGLLQAAGAGRAMM